MLMRLGLLGAFAWLVPERFWRPWRRFILRVELGLGLRRAHPARAGQYLANIEEVMGRSLTPQEAKAVEYGIAAAGFDDTMRILRSYHPLGWHPKLTLHGAEHLDRALDEGHGVILWVAVFSGSRLAVKMALHQAGYEVHHLSRPGHGFSFTDFAIHYLNPIWVRVEDRFLAERIRVTDETTVQAVKTIRKRLAANKIVSITDTNTAKQCLDVPFLNGHRRYATGAAHFSVSAGAALLPVFAIETDYRSFDVIIGERLHPKSSGSATPSIESLMAEYSASLGEMASRYPSLWKMWPDAKADRAAVPSADGTAADA